MAVKEAKRQENATEEVKVEGNKPAEEKTDSGANTAVTAAKETVRLVYVGPSLPKGQLKTNRIFIGTEAEIKKELETVLEKYPLVWKMLVPVKELAEKKDKVKTAGNVMNKYYSDIASSIAANLAKEG